ncbi:MAG TPA: methylenetetrahydrofolate reductase C-terminal domain-containing protein [Candidatus Sulfomarinibacteraceae bacterium]|nr:methylenetetrahydrofolate reductase C-terminal domain-containing protein [Candidatus Sulfomarinibacteraceae bacterium]
MIVAEQKPLAEIKGLLGDARTVLIVGCGTCVTVCFAGGEREASVLGSLLRMSSRLDGAPTAATEVTVQRQCEWEYLDAIGERVADADVVLSLGCGVGVQALAERFPEAVVVPGLNTKFMGMPLEQGVWAERCAACGECLLGLTGGICPIARCAKQLLNGPCGGSSHGKCEISPEIDCAWQLIHDKLRAQGRLSLIMEITPPRDWRTSRDGGPRRIVRDDLRLPTPATSEA